MSQYGLIKATSRIQRADSIADLLRVNTWRRSKGLKACSPSKPSVRQIENCIALAIEGLNLSNDFPPLVRGLNFYLSILAEITPAERKRFELINQTSTHEHQ